MSTELWTELGDTMRVLRRAADLSLRQVERRARWGRGTLSQVENGKARPARALVEWYDDTLGGDGLLLSLYAEARGAHRTSNRHGASVDYVEGDEFTVVEARRAIGERVAQGGQTTAGWRLRNSGCVRWTDRRVARVGAHAAPRLISSAPWVQLPDCGPDSEVSVEIDLQLPKDPGTLAAYWQVVDAAGHGVFRPPSLLPVILLVTDLT